jgi:thiamine-phosphate pyrophosphorylase
MIDDANATRLFLVTPPDLDAARFGPLLAEALAAGDVAAVLIVPGTAGKGADAIAAPLLPLIQDAGAATLVADDTRLAGRLKADGVHIGTGFEDLRLALDSFKPQRIVGAGNLGTRHAAMEAAEAGADYLFFGRPHGDTHDAAYPKALDLAEWCADVMEVPAVMMAGRSLDSVAEAAATGAAFVALHAAVWSNADGPGEAVRRSQAALAARGRRAA